MKLSHAPDLVKIWLISLSMKANVWMFEYCDNSDHMKFVDDWKKWSLNKVDGNIYTAVGVAYIK